MFCVWLHQLARQFYIAQWYRDSAAEAERATKSKKSKNKDKDSGKDGKENRRSSRRTRRISSSDEEGDSDMEKNPDDVTNEVELKKEIMEQTEKRKQFLLGQVASKIRAFASFK